MKVIKYIIEGIGASIDVFFGGERSTNLTQGLIGILTLTSILACFWISLFIINKKPNMKFYKSVLLSLLTTFIYILLFFLVCLLISIFIK